MNSNLSQPVKYHNRRQHTGRLVSITLQSKYVQDCSETSINLHKQALMCIRRSPYIRFSSILEDSMVQSYLSMESAIKYAYYCQIRWPAINSSLENSRKHVAVDTRWVFPQL